MAESYVSHEAVFATLMLWKKGDKKFSKKELTPVKNINVSSDLKTVQITLADQTQKTVTFN